MLRIAGYPAIRVSGEFIMPSIITQPVVLMYHGIIAADTAVPQIREAGAELYDVTAENFHAQLSWLQKNNYRTITIRKNLDAFSTKEILLTFDDGEMNNCKIALPILQEFGFEAHFFLIAKRIGKEGYMGWEEIRRLIESGMVIGSHGFSHEILTNLLDTQVEEELSASKKYLERNLGISIESISIPRGFCNAKIVHMAREAGYKYVFVSDKPEGVQTTNCLSRIAVKSNWSIDRFAKAMHGKAPLTEMILVGCKNSIKKTLGGGFYDWIRKMMLKIK